MVSDKKGRLLLEWVQRVQTNDPGGRTYAKFAWERPLRFGLSPEEMGLYLSRLEFAQAVEFHRQNRSDNGSSNGAQVVDAATGSMLKVFRAQPLPDGTVRLECDFELNGRGGQEPPTEYASRGPLGIDLQ